MQAPTSGITSNKAVVILCSVDDGHSNDLAAGFRSCAGADVYLIDYDGKVFRYQSDGLMKGTWISIGQGKNLLTKLNARYPSHSSIVTGIQQQGNRFFDTVDPSLTKQKLRFCGSPLSEKAIVGFLLPSCLTTACQGKQVLYAMPPCAFNRVPAYLLHFSHKLTLVGNVATYAGTGTGGLSGRALDLPELVDAHRTLIDVSVCRYIYDKRLRFYGTCHGAQMMWLAMGQTLTRHARLRGDQAGSLQLTEKTRDTHHLAYDGVGLTTHNKTERHKEIGGVRTLDAWTACSLTNVKQPFTYSTDYNHSHMMIAPEWFEGLIYQCHDIGTNWTEHQEVYPNSQSWSKLRKRKDSIVAYFKIDSIYCFQDHPSYHLEETSAAYDKFQVVNPEYKNSRLILGKYIWM